MAHHFPTHHFAPGPRVYKVGDPVEYYSTSRNAWLQTTISTISQVSIAGPVQVACKPDVWIQVSEFASKLRPVGAPVEKHSHGGVATYKVGAPVEYYSATKAMWLQTTISQVNSAGAIEVACKPGAWIQPAEFVAKLRTSGAQVGQHNHGAAAAYEVGASVEYYSTSMNVWMLTAISQVSSAGAIEVACKPGVWIQPAEFASKLRHHHEACVRPSPQQLNPTCAAHGKGFEGIWITSESEGFQHIPGRQSLALIDGGKVIMEDGRAELLDEVEAGKMSCRGNIGVLHSEQGVIQWKKDFEGEKVWRRKGGDSRGMQGLVNVIRTQYWWNANCFKVGVQTPPVGLNTAGDPEHLTLGVSCVALDRFFQYIGAMARRGRKLPDWFASQFPTINNVDQCLVGYEVADIIREFMKTNSWEDASVLEVLLAQACPGVRRANRFLSHSQAETIYDTLRALRGHDESEDTDKSQLGHLVAGERFFYFVDYVCIRQCMKGDFVPDSVRQVIKNIGHTVAFLSVPDATVLRRAWCVFELVCTMSSNVQLSVTFGELDQSTHFQIKHKYGKYGEQRWKADICSIPIELENCKAKDETDKEMIMKDVAVSIGIACANSLVKSAIAKVKIPRLPAE